MTEHEVAQLDPLEAHALLAHDPAAVLLDVRSRMEFEYVGHPVGALNVPWSDWPEWKPDPAFPSAVHEALRGLGRNQPERTPVLLLCRSGGRSLAAARVLLRAGFEEVYNVREGFEGERNAERHRSSVNGWRFRGLPWEQG